MNTPLSQEEKDLIELFQLLEETFRGKDTKRIEEAKNKLQQKFVDINYCISLLFKALSITTIENKKISEEIHKSVAIYLKNIFSSKNEIFDKEVLYAYLKKLFQLLFIQSKVNLNLNVPTIFSTIQNAISSLLSTEKIVEDKNYINELFNILLQSIKSETKENFLQTAKTVILLSTSLLTSRSANNNNYEELVNNFYIPIVNQIFAKVPIFLDPKNNLYNNDFISLLKYLFDGFYTNLTKMRGIFETEKRKEICFKFFREYGLYSYELIRLMPPFDEPTAKKYGKPNPIIVFNIDEKKCSEINHMKSKAMQFLSFITQVSTLEEKNMDEDNKNFINDKELVELINKIIFLIVNTFEDILNNKEKYYFVRKYRDSINEEEDCFNILLFQLCVFLTRCLIREPIKEEFTAHIKQFLLNILFPMMVTTEEEKLFLEADPEEYHSYINDITNEFKVKSFRTSGCFLINKICERYEDMSNFVLSFCLEMFNYIINEGNIKSEVIEYNVYLKYIKEALINQFNDKIKLDFALLIILILKNKLKKIHYIKYRLREIFISNQDKIHLITSPVIKVKLCKIYSFFLPRLFKNSNDVNENVKKQFIENAINFLLNNIIQQNQSGNNTDYLQSLSYEASDSITEIFNLPKTEEYKDNQLLIHYISQNLEKNFGILNKLIENVDVYSFFLVIDQILNNIKIEQRNLLFECINNLTKKFQKQFLGQSSDNKLFCSQYFNILNSFLTGVNKLLPQNKEEINEFNKIFDPILNYIKNPKKFLLYEELVSITEDYIKALNGINERSALVLKNIKLILDKEQTTSTIIYNFVSTFLLNIQNNISDEPLDQTDLFNEILIIIKKSFSFVEETYETSKIYGLLLTLQILNLNPNFSEEILDFLINQSLNSFEYIDLNKDYPNEKININQLALANTSLGFIFKPDLTFKVLQKTIKLLDNKEITSFDKFCHLIIFLINLTYPDYNPLLGKCIILGICGILTDKTCMDYLNAKKDNKLYLLKVFINFMLVHKKEKNKILNKLMKKELKCNFVEDENDEEEEEEEEEEINIDFNEKVENVLICNENINNCDEFKYYTQVMKYIRENDPEMYSHLQKETSNLGRTSVMEQLFKVRNIKITYNNKDFTVPRKTVKIVKSK